MLSGAAAGPLQVTNSSAAVNQQHSQSPPESQSRQRRRRFSRRKCGICRHLEIGSKSEQDGEVQYGTIASITWTSLNLNCSLCQQLHAIFRSAEKNYSLPRPPLRLELSRQALQILDHRGSLDGNQLNIHFPEIRRNVRLLPLEASFKASRYIDGCSAMEIGKDLDLGLDLNMVRSMLHDCRERHDGKCQPMSLDGVVLRLIDCKSRRVVRASSDEKYICLSYVWGQNHASTGSGQDPTGDMPKTVEDAMFVALRLGIPFLWVDKYCIDQDNPQEKLDIIRKMDRIYSGAQLTIIASVGEDPSHGLPGVRGTPRLTQFKLRGDMTTYVAVESVTKETLESVWNSRGWYVPTETILFEIQTDWPSRTYQEMLLSRRRLVFAKSQMYFECQYQHALESAPGLTSSVLARDQQIFLKAPASYDAFKLPYYLEQYFLRRFSFEKDIVDALLGIIDSFNNRTLFYGIILRKGSDEWATGSFLQNLLWHVSYTGQYDPKPASSSFPSWTWASIQANAQPDTGSRILHARQEHSGLEPHFSDICVEIWHESEGCMDISEFARHQDSYKSFEPWFDITTWIRRCAISNENTVDLYNNIIVVDDDVALQLGEVHAICLKVPPLDIKIKSSTTVNVEGLIVVEVKSHIYRRIDIFSIDIPFDLFSLFFPTWHTFVPHTPETIPKLRKNLPVEPRDIGEVEWKRWLKEHKCTGPQIIDKLPGQQWERRTIRMV